jgi:hypothetical protein
MGDSCFRTLGQMNHNYVATPHTKRSERVGETAAKGANLAERITFDVVLVIFVKERRLIFQVRMAVDTVHRDIVIGRNLPSVTRAGISNVPGVFNRLFAKADYSHNDVSSEIFVCVPAPVQGRALVFYDL